MHLDAFAPPGGGGAGGGGLEMSLMQDTDQDDLMPASDAEVVYF